MNSNNIVYGIIVGIASLISSLTLLYKSHASNYQKLYNNQQDEIERLSNAQIRYEKRQESLENQVADLKKSVSNLINKNYALTNQLNSANLTIKSLSASNLTYAKENQRLNNVVNSYQNKGDK